jgi:hypothetical protein
MGTMYSNPLNVPSVSTRGDGASSSSSWAVRCDEVLFTAPLCFARAVFSYILRHGPRSTENMSRVRMRVYWPAAQHSAWRGPHRKHIFCCSLQPNGTHHSRKHSLSTVVWRHHVRKNVPSAHCIATVRGRTTGNTAPLLSRMRVYCPVT